MRRLTLGLAFGLGLAFLAAPEVSLADDGTMVAAATPKKKSAPKKGAKKGKKKGGKKKVRSGLRGAKPSSVRIHKAVERTNVILEETQKLVAAKNAGQEPLRLAVANQKGAQKALAEKNPRVALHLTMEARRQAKAARELANAAPAPGTTPVAAPVPVVAPAAAPETPAEQKELEAAAAEAKAEPTLLDAAKKFFAEGEKATPTADKVATTKIVEPTPPVAEEEDEEEEEEEEVPTPAPAPTPTPAPTPAPTPIK